MLRSLQKYWKFFERATTLWLIIFFLPGFKTDFRKGIETRWEKLWNSESRPNPCAGEAHREANWSPIKWARLLIVVTLSAMIQPSTSLVHETEENDRHFDRPSNYVCCHFSLYGTLISGPLNNPLQSTRIAHCVTHFLHIFYELLVDRHLNGKQASIIETIETSNTSQGLNHFPFQSVDW